MITFTHIIHDPNFKGTFAINLPTKSELERMFITHSNALLVTAGYSMVHHLDKFDRKVGREVSQATMDNYAAELRNIRINGTSHILRFFVTPKVKKLSETPITFSFGISTVAETETVRLLYVEVL